MVEDNFDITFLNSYQEINEELPQIEIDNLRYYFNNLVSGVKQIKSQYEELRLGVDKENYGHLLKNFRIVEKNALVYLENEAPYFNIFSTLNIAHYETKVHTPFLSNLLDTNGSHGQGRLFFNTFISHLFKGRIDTEFINDIYLKQEERSDFGQVDIIIRYRYKGVGRVIIIENKIYHHDEFQQLERYYKRIKDELFISNGNFHLIYLTVNGRQPSERSISNKLFQQLRLENAISCWSYYEDIVSILNESLKKNKAAVVSETINQYIKTILSL
ncbi:PD-(D/E)XK nuclease family protein [Perlabentimonas gracilis]|uniref:PD-(D/E)XK nuclease family protein n=1 Tax=Perlabentimonas gracilis TaxID=2715279 RepID=UPI001408612D|nr:PD-(D/E)XK nuclease family protein [Perlabentimonas gracilis]NHB67315.1 PD-(D/E)XK nuclease family protein [Perlabentimonas gracilis]